MEIKIPTKHKNKSFSIALDNENKYQEKLAILCPGFLDSKDYPHLKTLSQELINLGFVSVRINALGVWKSDGDIQDYTTSEYLENVQQTIQYMDSYNQIPFKEIIFIGHSLGGLISFFSAAKEPRTSAIIAIMPPINQTFLQPEKLQEWKEQKFRTFRREIPDNVNHNTYFKAPFTYMVDAKKYTVLDVVNTVDCKKLLIASENDTVISVNDVQKIFTKISGENKKFIITKDIDHNYRLFPDQVKDINGVVVEWLVGKTLF